MKRCDHCGQPVPNQHGVICHDNARIVMFGGQVSDVLTPQEYEIVRYLVHHFGQFCSLDRLTDYIYQLDNDPPLHARSSVSTAAGRARAKLSTLNLIVANHYTLGWQIKHPKAKAAVGETVDAVNVQHADENWT